MLLQAGLITSALVLYLLFIRKQPAHRGEYKLPGWNYPLKLLLARYAVKRWKAGLHSIVGDESPRGPQHEGWDSISIRTAASNGVTVLLGVRKLCGRQPMVEIIVYVKLKDGTSYELMDCPDTLVGAWLSTADGWRAGGLKIQILEPRCRMRILYNGLLKRTTDNVTQHVTFNLTWTSSSVPVEHPKDWNEKLAAQTLALEPWRDSQWSSMLGKWEEGSWLQWGTVQGRFQSFTAEGALDTTEYLQTRGVKERHWAPHAYEGTRRSFSITASARDGTAVVLRGVSYKKVLTQCLSGCVRLPDYRVLTITDTDLIMSDFCETPGGIPNAYTINIHTEERSLKVVLRIGEDGFTAYSGVPYQQELVYRAIVADIDGEAGSGILELGYLPKVIAQPSVRLTPAPILKWLLKKDAGFVGYCLSFEECAATCTDYVGGKGASLALLASVQNDEGYRVPPGFCITTKALEKHLQLHTELKAAIQDIEAANENYEEAYFKEQCQKVSSLFLALELSADIKKDILEYMQELRSKSAQLKDAQELRFAVRSSAVGEDSEALSAAGQNETILGCVTDDDVIRAVQKCWGSMFEFTSTYYRRQNGQVCLCGGGVVVQTLVSPRVAGVMFTRHPDAGDPSRLLITANYGLGESVVSGTVEPDTIIVKREPNGVLTIQKRELGSKTRRHVASSSGGVTTEDVPERERSVACLNDTEVLKLARLGVVQEELWGAGRDIEWAISGDQVYLLQARPITSLERWTEEELLHEVDSPIMADNELTTFGNTGEVLPKPVTPLSYDLVIRPLIWSMDRAIITNGSQYDHSLTLSHYRCAISLYNSVYRRVPKKLDTNIRMMEMAINGHKVADENIHKTALIRRKPHWTDRIRLIHHMIMSILTSKWKLNDTVKKAKDLEVGTNAKEPIELLESIAECEDLIGELTYNHSVTTVASTSSQIIAMTILMEGSADFTPEQCNEISKLLSSGDVLSAEVPQCLANLTRQLEKSRLMDEFRAQDPKHALRWLKRNLPHIYLDICTFLEHHGYRAIMEFDLYTKPWILVPEEMMKILQNLRSSPEEPQQSKTTDEVIASLTTPKKNSTRKVLRWVLPLCRRAVRHREGTKAHLILAAHKMRLALLRLGEMLVRQWYLPHPDLVFFFRLGELQEYVRKRDPVLLKKAIQRQQYYPKWCKLKFNELNNGWIEPLEAKGPSVRAGDVRIEATSVCGGVVVARACVVKELSEVDQLQQGDVLITHATDIGWSPYFPLLTGIVTELGGLISHGAVIAREYGLPCIVGATDATEIFRTGDLVRLSGTKGVLEKVVVENKPGDEQIENAVKVDDN